MSLNSQLGNLNPWIELVTCGFDGILWIRFPGILLLICWFTFLCLFSVSFIVFLFIFCFIHFIVLSVWKLAVIKSSTALGKITAKTANSSKKCSLDVTGVYVLSIPNPDLLTFTESGFAHICSIFAQCGEEGSLCHNLLFIKEKRLD